MGDLVCRWDRFRWRGAGSVRWGMVALPLRTAEEPGVQSVSEVCVPQFRKVWYICGWKFSSKHVQGGL